MPNVTEPRTPTLWASVALSGASIALRIAKEATSDVPIVRQILGVTVNIMDLAEKIEKNREALHALVDKTATLAEAINKIVSGRIIDEQLTQLLERLTRVFKKVEDLMSKEARKSNIANKLYRGLFVIQRQTEKLSEELDTEIRLLTLAALLRVDTKTHSAENPADNQFRRLREYEVHTLGIITERETEGGTVTFAKARVEGTVDLMVVKYLKPRTPQNRVDDDLSRHGILAAISSLEMSHPNVARLYGLATERGSTSFTVLRAGVYPALQYLHAIENIATRRMACYGVELSVLGGAAHLEHMAFVWHPCSYQSIVVDDHGQPFIGAFDDLVHKDAMLSKDHAANMITVLAELQDAALDQGDVQDEYSSLDTCNEGRLKSLFDGIHSPSSILEHVWNRVHFEELAVNVERKTEPFHYYTTLSPMAVAKAVKYSDDVSARFIVFPFKQKADSERSLHHRMRRGLPPRAIYVGHQSISHLEGHADEEVHQPHGHVEVRFWSSQDATYKHELTVFMQCWSKTSYTGVTYAIALSERIAADISRILGLPDDTVPDTRWGQHIQIFEGVFTVPACMISS